MRRNWLEWVVLALSIGAILTVATVLLLDGVGGASDPPDPRVELRMEEALSLIHISEPTRPY